MCLAQPVVSEKRKGREKEKMKGGTGGGRGGGRKRSFPLREKIINCSGQGNPRTEVIAVKQVSGYLNFPVQTEWNKFNGILRRNWLFTSEIFFL